MRQCELCDTSMGEGWCSSCARYLNAQSNERDQPMTITTQAIGEALARAADTLRALPLELDAAALEERTGWPALILEARATYLAQQAGQRVAPTPEEVEALAEAVAWLEALDERTAMIVWLRAEGQRWRTITERTGCVRHRAWQRWQAGLTRIAQHVRAQAQAEA